MTERETLAKLHDEALQADLAVRRKEHEMEEVEHAMERLLKQFEEDERKTEQQIEAAWHRGHPGIERRPLRRSD